MGTPRPQRRRRPTTERETTNASFTLSAESMRAVDRLVDAEVYANRSHAVDAALKHLIAFNADYLREQAVA